jgi:hypothetical protein
MIKNLHTQEAATSKLLSLTQYFGRAILLMTGDEAGSPYALQDKN